ncbi:MAG TPA: VanW family protein [Desulfosporosinus sp.]|nr:VanW family protein [Desulfosporosinus sp.]
MKQPWMRTFVKTLALLLFTLLIGGCAFSNNLSENKILSNQSTSDQGGGVNGVMPEGTIVDDLDLSGSTTLEAQTKIKDWAMDKLEEKRVLLYNETEIPITLKDLAVEMDDKKTTEGIERNPGTTVSSVLKVDSLKAKQELQEKLKNVSKPAENASYKIVKDKFVVNPALSGQAVDIDKLISDIQKVSLSDVPNRIEIPMADVPAAVTTEAIQSLAFDSIIGEYTTKFAVTEKNRSANLAAAAKAMDRKVLRPGETFSFNGTVGPRLPGKGYKNAFVIINGEYVQGSGGGVCQVSSTLYNAVLLSNLAILERMPHAIAVSYVPQGQDATVNYPDLDFKFKNNTANVLYLRAEVIPGSLTLRIWGKKTEKSIRIERQVEKEINFKTEKRLDPNLSPGQIVQKQAGSKGAIVKIWKVIRDGTGKETKQFLSRDVYAPTNRILRAGS